MAALGLSIAPGQIRAELAHPRRLTRGLVLNLVIAPIATVLCLRVLGVAGWVAAGLTVLAVSPGAPLSPSTAVKAGGSASYSLVLTGILGVVTAFSAAPMGRWLLSYEGNLAVRPPALIAKLALLQWLPLGAGILVRRWSPGRVGMLERVGRAAVVISGLGLVIGSVVPLLSQLGIIGWRGLLATVVSMAVVVVLAWLVGGDDDQLSGSLTATVSVPNVGLAMTLARSADAPRPLLLTIASIFLLRAVLNKGLVQILRRMKGHPAQPGAISAPRGAALRS
jgi:BASS family bile acid:Na+ symporter